MQKKYFCVIAGLVLFFSFFSFVDVKAQANCSCTLTLKYTGDQTKIPCYDNSGGFKEGNNCDCNNKYLISPPFASDNTFIFSDVLKKFEEMQKPVIPGSEYKCALFKFLQDSKDELLQAKINPTGNDCTYDSGTQQPVLTLNSTSYPFNYSMSCVSSPVPHENGCWCNFVTDEKFISWPAIKDQNGCLELISKNKALKQCDWYAEGKLVKSATSQTPPAVPSSPTAPQPPSSAGTAATPEATGQTSPGEYQSSNAATKNWIKEHYDMPPGYTGVIPKCAFSGTCENVNDLLQLGINIGKYVFSIIGSVAFLAFVYGGFTIVFSFGSAEKVKKGTEVLIAAVTGMAIAFGAYMLINFILDALNVTQDFRGIK